MKLPVRIGAVMSVLLVGAALTAACAGGGRPSGVDASGAAGGQAEMRAYVDCLNQHGVTIAMPSSGADRSPISRRGPGARRSGFPSQPPASRPSDRPGGFGGFRNERPEGVDEATWAAAQQACASVRPTGNAPQDSAQLAYRNCLADHGVSRPVGPGELTTADPKTAAAMKVCEPLRPIGGPRRPGTPGATPTPTG